MNAKAGKRIGGIQQLNDRAGLSSMDDFEALMYVPVCLAELELALTSKNRPKKTDCSETASAKFRNNLFSQVA